MDDVQSSPPRVRRRIVLLVPGFDPVPPRAHRERYRREAARQAEFSGHEITLGPSRTGGGYGWHVAARIEGAEVATDVEVLEWADIVRASMAQGIAATYGQLLRTAGIYVGSGVLFRLMRLRKGPVIAALYPVAVLLAQGLAAIGTAVGILALLRAAAVWGGLGFGLALAVLAAVAGMLAGIALLRHWARRDGLYAWYLVRDYAFTARHAGAYPPELEARLDVFSERIAAALAEPVDEVLVVGHSSGAHVAVSALADVLRTGLRDGAPALGLLTLGQVVPMASFLPRAVRLRSDLARLAVSDRLAWVDVSAPGDGCAFALCDPVAVSGVAGPDRRWPLVLSAAFTRTLSKAARDRLRWRFLERHFQYMNAFDGLSGQAGEYDWFAVSAGPRTLSDRFAARKPSPRRIDRPVSRYTDRAA